MKVLFTYEDTAHAAEIEYAVGVLLGGLELELRCAPETAATGDHDLRISYGSVSPATSDIPRIHIAASDFFLRSWTAEDLYALRPDAESWVPFIGSGADFVHAGEIIRTNRDFIAATYFLAARFEEHVIAARDDHGRFRASDSYTAHNGGLRRPLIDEWVAQLQMWGRLLGRPLERRAGDFYIGLTHDIDQVSGGWAEAIYHTVRQRSGPGEMLRTTATVLRERLRGRDPYWTFARLLAVESELGVRSSFYFLPRTGERHDAHYDWNAPRFRELFATLRAGGWEIGLHGSYRSIEAGRLKDERAALQNAAQVPVSGGRQHYLRFDVRSGFEAYQAAGLRYDSSLGYAEALGFRAGLCRPYHPFCPVRRAPFELIEIPLIIMDTTLRTYEKVPIERVWDRVLPYLEQVRGHRGAAAILWHNTYFAGHKFTGYDEIYRRIIRWVQERGGRCGPLEGLVARARDFLLCPTGDGR